MTMVRSRRPRLLAIAAVVLLAIAAVVSTAGALSFEAPGRVSPPATLDRSATLTLDRYVQPVTSSGRRVERLLCVGDGDLSCAEKLAAASGAIRVLATVPDASPDALAARYGDEARRRCAALHAVCGVDATRLGDALASSDVEVNATPTASVHGRLAVASPSRDDDAASSSREASSSSSNGVFDRVVFNFPHAPGKMNIRRNRALVTAFLASAASEVLADDGEVLVALLPGQGGTEREIATAADPRRSYDASLRLDVAAAEAGLRVVDIVPFAPFYAPRGHRATAQRGVPVALRADGALVHVLARRGTAVSAPGFATEIRLLVPSVARVPVAERGVLRAVATWRGAPYVRSVELVDVYHGPTRASEPLLVKEPTRLGFRVILGTRGGLGSGSVPLTRPAALALAHALDRHVRQALRVDAEAAEHVVYGSALTRSDDGTQRRGLLEEVDVRGETSASSAAGSVEAEPPGEEAPQSPRPRPPPTVAVTRPFPLSLATEFLRPRRRRHPHDARPSRRGYLV